MNSHFAPEYITEIFDGYTVAIEKIGGGTVGNSYDGAWAYLVTRSETGEVVASGDHLWTGTPKTHAEAAEIVIDYFTEEI